MGKNAIDLDQIEARLRGVRSNFAPRGDDENEDAQAASNPFDDEPDSGSGEGSGSGTVMFVSLVALLFAAVMGGVMFFPGFGGGGIASLFTWSKPVKVLHASSVAAQCDKGWQANERNVDQMHCYLTTDIGRLCRPEEKLALFDRIEAYEDAAADIEAQFGAASMQVIAGTQANGLAIGLADAKSRDPNASADERQAQEQKAFELGAKTLSRLDAVIEREARTHKVPTFQLGMDIAALAQKGYLQDADVSWSAPDWVSRGMRSAGTPPPSPCK
jgi:hypothetical protein